MRISGGHTLVPGLVRDKHSPGQGTYWDIFPVCFALANSLAERFSASGEGQAVDTSLTWEDATANTVVVGLGYRMYTYIPGGPNDKVGEVEYEWESVTKGRACLMNADCHAAALGAGEFLFKADDAEERMLVYLDESVGTTDRS